MKDKYTRSGTKLGAILLAALLLLTIVPVAVGMAMPGDVGSVQPFGGDPIFVGCVVCVEMCPTCTYKLNGTAPCFCWVCQ